jgi:hypothetical protein
MLLRQEAFAIPIPTTAINRNSHFTRIPISRKTAQMLYTIAKFLKKHLQNLKPVHPWKMVVLRIKLPIMRTEETEAEAPSALWRVTGNG